ncbi:glycine zipper 2TM domain-containing protein [Massilia luteola]|uniref:glycine zipper 2TM domain-containing protein n=1 Tax=Massilia luteola TaxID=3081751 RepID=UPI002ACC2947|nr:glycine zipper 2TM domain-containing protein [Massilia sp. Gc5]
MEAHPTPPTRARQHPLLIAAAVAIILFCAIGTAAIMGWLPTSSGGNRGQLNEADRAALSAGLQQPGHPGYAAPGALPPATVPAAPLAAQPLASPGVATPGYVASAPAQSTYPAPAGAQAYGDSGSQGATGAGADYAAAPAPQYAPAAPRTAHKSTRVAQADTRENWCGNCGNIESIRLIKTRAQGSGVGAAGGAILGGLLGHQLGGGHGQQLATVAGAVGGAVVGNQVEGNMKADTSYEIRVRLDDGSLRTFHQHSVPPWRTGDRVRIVKGTLRSA